MHTSYAHRPVSRRYSTFAAIFFLSALTGTLVDIVQAADPGALASAAAAAAVVPGTASVAPAMPLAGACGPTAGLVGLAGALVAHRARNAAAEAACSADGADSARLAARGPAPDGVGADTAPGPSGTVPPASQVASSSGAGSLAWKLAVVHAGAVAGGAVLMWADGQTGALHPGGIAAAAGAGEGAPFAVAVV